jgi:hypothetical protein
MDSGASIHMTYDKKLFNGIQEKERGRSVEFGDNATYLVRRLGSISFSTPSRDVLELNDILFVPGLKRNLLSIPHTHTCKEYNTYPTLSQSIQMCVNPCLPPL